MNKSPLEVSTFNNFRPFTRNVNMVIYELVTWELTSVSQNILHFYFPIGLVSTQVFIFRLPQHSFRLWYCNMSVDQRRTRLSLFRS